MHGARGARHVTRLDVADASVCRPIALHADMRPGLTAITTVQKPTSLIASDTAPRTSGSCISNDAAQALNGNGPPANLAHAPPSGAVTYRLLFPSVRGDDTRRAPVAPQRTAINQAERQRDHTRRRVHLQAGTFTGSASAHHLKE